MKGKKTAEKKKICFDIDEKGSTFITVLVAISFMMVLASIIIAVSMGNLQMKQIEYASKKNFYVTEQGIEDIYNGIGREASGFMAKSYNDILTQVTDHKFLTQSTAYEAFSSTFVGRLKSYYGDDGEKRDLTLGKLRDYLTTDSSDSVVEDFGGIRVESNERYIFKDVVVRHTDDNDYETVVTTDIVIEVPYINFFQDFSRVLDYSLIGNKGVYFLGCNRDVEGNIYAGTDAKEKNATYQGYTYSSGSAFDGINFYQCPQVNFIDNAYIVSKGDFNLCQSNVNLKSNYTSPTINLWVENIRTVEQGKQGSAVLKGIGDSYSGSTLTSFANMYVADDLELNERKSTVALSGNYYGYNYNTDIINSASAYETQEYKNLIDKYNTVEHAKSSAIMINANETVLNMEGLDSLIVAGLAYLDVRNPNEKYYDSTAKANEYRTGESVSLRYNQMLYLAPEEILNYPNPYKGTVSDLSLAYKDSISVNKWFGSKYLAVVPIKAVTYGDSVYFFLNFKSTGDESSYMEEILSAKKPTDMETATEEEKQKWEMLDRIQQKIEAMGTMQPKISVNGSDCKIYTRGIVSDTSAAPKATSDPDSLISVPIVFTNSLNMANHYVYLYKKLDPREQFSDTSDLLSIDKLDEEIAKAGLNENDLPLDFFVNLNLIAGNFESKVNGYDVIIRNSPAAPITSDVNGIVLAKGDITIEDGVKINGLVIAGGKITVKGSGSISSNKGIIQSVLEQEQRELTAVKDKDKIVWNKYATYYFKQDMKDDEGNILTFKDKIESEYFDISDRITSTEYADYVYYENWRKGKPVEGE